MNTRFARIRRDLRVAALYALFGGAWILLSDLLVEVLYPNPRLITQVQTYKGIAFVLLSTVLLYTLLRLDLEREAAARAQLRESEDRYRRLFDNSPEAILLTEPDGAVRAANPAACRLFGRTEAEICAVGRAGLVDAGDPRLETALRERERTGAFHGVLTFVRPDGTRFEGEVATNVYPNAEGQPRTSLFVRDVTERRRAEDELQRAYATLYTAMDQSQAGVAIADSQGRVQYINRSGLEIGGKPEGDLAVGIDQYVASWNLAHLDQTPMKAEDVPLARAILREEANSLEFLVRRNDGDVVVLTNAAPVRSREGRVVGGVAVFLDVTSRKRAEERLVRLNRTYALLSQINQAIVRERDPRTLFEEACRIAVDLGGFRMAWIGIVDPETRLVRRVAHAGLAEGYLEQLEIMLGDDSSSSGPTGTAVATKRRTIANDIATDPSMAPWRDAALRCGYRASAAFPLVVEGEVAGALNLYSSEPDFFDDEEAQLLDEMAGDIGFAMEFSARLERQQAAEAARQEALEQVRALNLELERRVAERTSLLEAANRELEAFSYSVSHDLRAPLRAIDGWAGVLAEDYGELLGEEGRSVLGRLRAAGKRMADLIEDLLQLSRVHQHAIRPRRLDLGEMADQVWGDLQGSERTHHARLVVEELPECWADPSLVQQVLSNLLGNALKFAGPRESPTIEVGGHSEGSEAIYYVKDNGVGFEAAAAAKLFQPFQRLHDPKEYPGTGIGLAIVQRIVRLHGGRVWADGEPDKGATFFFSLPAPSDQ
ncbi:MAG: PAS domain S-box protein [Fimbriimonadaceae bacterium]|nr:PAS domain S-box protein [Fimbriimonadaceae bacterium]